MTDVSDAVSLRVVVLADDLIWSTRLASIVRAVGGTPDVVGSVAGFAQALPEAKGAIVDLSTRRADPLAAVHAATDAGVAVVGVGPHVDVSARREAIAAGARRVYAYSKLFEDGPRVIARWLGLPPPIAEAGPEDSMSAPRPTH